MNGMVSYDFLAVTKIGYYSIQTNKPSCILYPLVVSNVFMYITYVD